MMNAGTPVLPRPEWGAGISTCHLPPKQAVKPHPGTVGFQCWPPALSPQAEKLFELSWMWSLSKSSQLCFFKEEEPLKHPMGHFLSQPVLHSKDLETGNTRLRSSLSPRYRIPLPCPRRESGRKNLPKFCPNVCNPFVQMWGSLPHSETFMECIVWKNKGSSNIWILNLFTSLFYSTNQSLHHTRLVSVSWSRTKEFLLPLRETKEQYAGKLDWRKACLQNCPEYLTRKIASHMEKLFLNTWLFPEQLFCSKIKVFFSRIKGISLSIKYSYEGRKGLVLEY